MVAVVVGVGRSASSAAAVRWAVEAARLRGVPVTLLHAWNEPVEVEVRMSTEDRTGLPGYSTSRVMTGAPAAALLSAPAGLLVVGLPTGRRRPPGLVRAVLRGTRLPVVVVPQEWRQREGPVVVGLCGTSASAGALRWAAAEAGRRRVDLVVVHAWHGSVTSARDPRLPALPTGQSDVRDRVHCWVQAALGPEQVTLELSRGPRLEALLDGASTACLLVLGAGTHPGLDRLIHGTVGPDVVALAGCPVAVVPDCLASQKSSRG